jgi:hypothetical protein
VEIKPTVSRFACDSSSDCAKGRGFNLYFFAIVIFPTIYRFFIMVMHTLFHNNHPIWNERCSIMFSSEIRHAKHLVGVNLIISDILIKIYHLAQHLWACMCDWTRVVSHYNSLFLLYFNIFIYNSIIFCVDHLTKSIKPHQLYLRKP